ncbi:MAG TPA: hypothetical protein VIY08_15880 [Candidatus Nitrosocosmicus sp.]
MRILLPHSYLGNAIKIYRETFRPSKDLNGLYAIAAVNVVVTETGKKAKNLFSSVQLRDLGMMRNSNATTSPDHRLGKQME